MSEINLKITGFWDVMPCTLVLIYQVSENYSTLQMKPKCSSESITRIPTPDYVASHCIRWYSS
jgi:hypothetical protein